MPAQDDYHRKMPYQLHLIENKTLKLLQMNDNNIKNKKFRPASEHFCFFKYTRLGYHRDL